MNGAVLLVAALVDTSDNYDYRVSIYVPIAIVVVIGYAALRCRRRPVEQAARWHEHNRLEVTPTPFCWR